MRAADWEQRLAQTIRQGHAKPFSAKRWNCAIFAHDCAQAVLGVYLPEPGRSTWKGSLEASVDAMFPRSSSIGFARRGDLVLADAAKASLGVCIGATFLCVARTGLTAYPMTSARVAWRVG